MREKNRARLGSVMDMDMVQQMWVERQGKAQNSELCIIFSIVANKTIWYMAWS